MMPLRGFAPSQLLIALPTGRFVRADTLDSELVMALQKGIIRVFDLENFQELLPTGELEEIEDIDDVSIVDELADAEAELEDEEE